MLRRKPDAESEKDAPLAPETIVRRGPAVQANYEAAQSVLIELENEVAELALAAIERKPGAAEALAAQRERIDAARRAADELRAAQELANRLDRQTDAQAAVRMRAEQFVAFEKASAERVDAMSEVLKLIGQAAVTYGRYVKASSDLAVALPSGTSFPTMQYEGGTHFLGNGEALIGREAWRLAGPGTKPPFSVRPAVSAVDNVATMRPSADILREAHEAVLQSVKTQIERLDATVLERAVKTEQVA